MSFCTQKKIEKEWKIFFCVYTGRKKKRKQSFSIYKLYKTLKGEGWFFFYPSIYKEGKRDLHYQKYTQVFSVGYKFTDIHTMFLSRISTLPNKSTWLSLHPYEYIAQARNALFFKLIIQLSVLKWRDSRLAARRQPFASVLIMYYICTSRK